MPTESTPAAGSSNTPERTIADKYREAKADAKKERRHFLYWLAFLGFAIVNFGFRTFLVTANALTAKGYDAWDISWAIFAVLLVPGAVWVYSAQLLDYSRSKHRLSLAEAAALKEATKSKTDQ